jgi:hypothetical protein
MLGAVSCHDSIVINVRRRKFGTCTEVLETTEDESLVKMYEAMTCPGPRWTGE